nr:immunoglobulin heavy chain junction region [Mus musculus]
CAKSGGSYEAWFAYW